MQLELRCCFLLLLLPPPGRPPAPPPAPSPFSPAKSESSRRDGRRSFPMRSSGALCVYETVALWRRQYSPRCRSPPPFQRQGEHLSTIARYAITACCRSSITFHPPRSLPSGNANRIHPLPRTPVQVHFDDMPTWPCYHYARGHGSIQ
jgi:hypothetical protein